MLASEEASTSLFLFLKTKKKYDWEKEIKLLSLFFYSLQLPYSLQEIGL